MEFARAREFVIGAYHDLPNVLLVGSLLLGSITGYRPLLLLSIGLLAFNLPVTYLTQLGTGYFAAAKPYFVVERSGRCATFSQPSNAPSNNNNNLGAAGFPVIDASGPTWWMTSAAFFFFFTLYNAIMIMASPANPNATTDQRNNRNAYCYAVIVISVVFLFLASSRWLSGCETAAGGVVGLLLGIGLAAAYWHILDVCGNGLVPDILQIIGNSAPERGPDVTPVVCA